MPLLKVTTNILITLMFLVLSVLNAAAPVFATALPQSEINALSSYPNWVADCESSGATSPSATSAGPVYIMGDSITDIAKPSYIKKFKDAGWTPTVEGLGSRQIQGTPPAPDGLGQIEKDKSVIASSNAIVVALGTNGVSNSASTTKAQVTKALAKIKEYNTNNAPVYWVNVMDTLNKKDAQTTNAAIKDAAGNNAKIIDWYAESSSKADLASFNGGVHPTKQKDIDLLVNLVYNAVANGGSSTKATNGVEYDAGMTVDTDGVGSAHGEPSPPHQRGTSYATGRLNADETNYMVLAPGWASAHGLEKGDIAVVQYKGKSVYAVYGDNYLGNQIHGEGSYKLATELGMNNSPISGGVTSGVHYIVFPGSHKQLNGSVDQSKIDQIGQSLYGGGQPAASSSGCCPSGGSTNSGGKTVVIDPGHSGSNHKVTDPETGLNDYDWPNTPEITQVYDVSQKVKTQLEKDGYKVIMTKKSADDTVSFRERANIANNANADLAVSVHYDDGQSWADMGDVYAQVVGGYRQNKAGMGRGTSKISFKDAAVAAKSKQYADVFAKERKAAEKHNVSVKVNRGFTGRDDIASGDLAMVQLFSKVPWVYNEVGAKPTPMSSDHVDKYAQGIINGVEKSLGGSGGSQNSASTQSCVCSEGSGTGSGSSTNTPLAGKDNREKIFNYFVGKGLSGAQSAGIVGNFGQESSWNPSAQGGYLAQWGDERLTALENFARKQNKPVTDLGVQLDYTWLELTNGSGAAGDYSAVLKALKDTKTPEEAALVFSKQYEIAGDPRNERRQKLAKEAFTDFGSGGGAATTSGACGGSPDCQTASGTAKILCEAKKYDGIYYLWGGGHSGYDTFKKNCPADKINQEKQKSTATNQGPCATDCSGLVGVAVGDAFGFKASWTVGDNSEMQGKDADKWKKVNVSEARPGDIVTHPGHVEIVDSVSNGKVNTFGSHQTGRKTSPSQSSVSAWVSAFRWGG